MKPRFRIGSVPYLNAAPLTYGIEAECVFLPPAKLAAELHADRLEAALVSVSEILLHPGYRVMDGFGILSRGPVRSVFLAHRERLESIREIYLDPASCTSVNLLRVLLEDRRIYPTFRPLTDYSAAPSLSNVLLIGDSALKFRQQSHAHTLWDLGEAWQTSRQLPFVYAVWALRIDDDPVRQRAVIQYLQAAAHAGLKALPEIVRTHPDFDPELRRQYLGGNIHYRLDDAAKEGLATFAQSLARCLNQKIYLPNYAAE